MSAFANGINDVAMVVVVVVSQRPLRGAPGFSLASRMATATCVPALDRECFGYARAPL